MNEVGTNIVDLELTHPFVLSSASIE
jgi:hypothetical protein